MNHNTEVLRVGDLVKVQWGLDEVIGRVVDVWGDPPAHIRVELDVEDSDEPEVLLLSPKIVERVA